MNDHVEPHNPIELQKLNLDIEKHARERWWHEDHLINQRTTWLLTTQGVLSGAFGFLKYRIAEISEGRSVSNLTSEKAAYVGTLEQLSDGIFVIGFLSALASLIGIYAAVQAHKRLADQYPFVLGVSARTTLLGQVVACFTPILCASAWLVAFGILNQSFR